MRRSISSTNVTISSLPSGTAMQCETKLTVSEDPHARPHDELHNPPAYEFLSWPLEKPTQARNVPHFMENCWLNQPGSAARVTFTMASVKAALRT